MGQRSGKNDRAQQPIGLSERDDALIRAVYDFHFLTVDQVTRLFFSRGSVEHVRVVLKELSDTGYLFRLKMPSSQDGVKPYVYTLGRKGIRYLKTVAGYSEFARFRPSEEREHSYLFLAHTLGVNELLLAAKQLPQQYPEYVLADFLHERVLKRMPVAVRTAEGETMGIVPDLWVDFHLRGTDRASIVVEYDRGTVEQRQWRKKIRGLIAFADGPYTQAYGSESLTIAIVTTAGGHRAEVIRQWIEQELEKAKRYHDKDLFLVLALMPGEIDPEVFFLSPVWVHPFDSQGVSLLI